MRAAMQMARAASDASYVKKIMLSGRHRGKIIVIRKGRVVEHGRTVSDFRRDLSIYDDKVITIVRIPAKDEFVQLLLL